MTSTSPSENSDRRRRQAASTPTVSPSTFMGAPMDDLLPSRLAIRRNSLEITGSVDQSSTQ